MFLLPVNVKFSFTILEENQFSRCWYMLLFSPAWYRLRVPALFSRFRVFPRLASDACFPALDIGCMFSRAWHRLHFFPRLAPVTCFSFNFCLGHCVIDSCCNWSVVFTLVLAVTVLSYRVSLFQEKEKERKKRMEAEKSKRKPVVDMNAGLY